MKVRAGTPANIEGMTVRFYHPTGAVPGTQPMQWFDGTANRCRTCLQQTVYAQAGSGYAGYVDVVMNATTAPAPADLRGTVFAAGAANGGTTTEPVPSLSEWGMVCLTLVLAFAACRRTLGLRTQDAT